MKDTKISTIPGFPGYTITDDGHVFSTRSGEKVELKQRLAQNGYISVTVTRDDGRRTFEGIHYLKALAFLNDSRRADQNEVNHKDGNKLNNSLSNLEWCSRSENEKHKVSHFLTARTKPVVLVNLVTDTTSIAPSTREADRMLNVSVNSVSRALQKANCDVVGDCVIYFKEE